MKFLQRFRQNIIVNNRGVNKNSKITHQQISQIKINSKIIPNKGIGEIYLGMNSFYFRNIYSKNFNIDGTFSSEFDKGEWTYHLSEVFLHTIDLKYKDFISISINLFTGQVARIGVTNSFKGKILNLVGIGDTVRPLYAKLNSLNWEFNEFIEGQFFIKIDNQYCLSIFVGDDYLECESDEDFQRLLDMPITEILIWDDDQSIAVGIEKFPEKWNK
jgi:hypothetical protein